MGTAWITGICVRSDRLEWTVLRRVKEVWEVASQGREAVSADSAQVGWIPTAAILSKLKLFRGRVSVALPTERALLRVVVLPSVDADELRGMAELQTDRFSPFPVETVAAGAEVLRVGSDEALVALAVVRHEDVEALGAAFEGAGAPPDVVDVEALGWWWGVQRSGLVPAAGTHCVLRVELERVELVWVRDGVALAFRVLPGWTLGAEEGIADCAEELASALTALETEWGESSAPILHVFHTSAFSAGDFEQLCVAAGLSGVMLHALEYLPAASEGIARRQVEAAMPLAMDLAPEVWRTADADRRARRQLLRVATVFAAVWLAVLGIFWTGLHWQRGRLSRLQGQVDAVEGPAREVRRLQMKALEFAQYADRRHAALECLRVVAETLPQGVDLTSFVYRKSSTLVLRGEANAAEQVYRFIQALEQTELFPEVKSEGISTRGTPEGQKSQFGATLLLPASGAEGEP